MAAAAAAAEWSFEVMEPRGGEAGAAAAVEGAAALRAAGAA